MPITSSSGAFVMELCYIDGRFVPPKAAVLPVSDLMIQRGVGVFETIGTHERRPLMLTPHLERLLAGAERSRIRPVLSLEAMREVVRKGIASLDMEVQIKVYLSGGDIFEPERGFVSPRFFAVFERLSLPSPELYERGVLLEPVDAGRDNPEVKSVDYRATYALSRPDAFEVLYCPGGEITEGGHSSFFLVRDGVLITAPLSRVLGGTTRKAILEIARGEGIPVEERCPTLEELARAAEAFLTGSVKKVLPVSQIGKQEIGDGRPGPITARLSELYLGHIRKWLE